jgi:splicing factor 3B subunit 1
MESKNTLAGRFSVPQDIREELEGAGTLEDEHALGTSSIGAGSGSGSGSAHSNGSTQPMADRKKQQSYNYVKRRIENLNSVEDGEGSTVTGGNEIEIEDENESVEAVALAVAEPPTDNTDGDKTPPRERGRQRRPRNRDTEVQEQAQIAPAPIQPERDITPPRSDKNRVRRGRKRRRESGGDDDGNDTGESKDDRIREETPQRTSKSVVHVSHNPAIPVIMGIPLTTDNLNKLLPVGFTVVAPPESYEPLNNLPPDITKFEANIKNQVSLLSGGDENALIHADKFDPQLVYQIPDLKDLQYFSDLDMKVFKKLVTIKDKDFAKLSQNEQMEIKCMKLILRIKNGSTASRKGALRSLTDNVVQYGPQVIFDIMLPLLSDSQLDEQGRHLLIKVISRVLTKLGSTVTPYAEKLLIVLMPLLVDDSKITRLEGREIISKLSKTVGLVTIISILKPDLNTTDEYVRTIVARTFAVVASSLGIQVLIPLIRSLCHSKNDTMLQVTGSKVIQQIAIMLGSSILPFLTQLVHCLSKNLESDSVTVRITTAAAVSALAEASAPYGYESLKVTVQPIFRGLKSQKGKILAQFVKAMGNLIPLMGKDKCNYYAFELLKLMKREATTSEDDMKRAILVGIDQICKLDHIEPEVIYNSEIVGAFFKNFWSRRVALDKKITHLCINTCYSLSLKIGTSSVITAILPSLRDDSEPYRRMTLEASDRILTELGTFDLDDKTVNRLLDGLLYSFQHQNLENKQASLVILNGFANILNNLGFRVKPYVMQIISAILYRLKNKDSDVREQAADLISKIVDVLKVCGETDVLIRLCTILYESLGEVYPDVLGSILDALKNVILSIDDIDSLNPSIAQIMSTLIPILRNRHEKVQEMTIPLIGDIAIRAKDYISHKEWMRIAYELLEMLKAYRKSIRRSANRTFGQIAKVIGPADILVMLLNNLRMQERQLRVSTAVAIGIVAENCMPFSVLPALMNEYRYPDKNVQNGVLKAFGFMFEYIGDLGSDYIYAATPLLLDALTDRDLVHRQIASNVVKHMALGSFGLGYQDAFLNFLNLIWPNIFETSPHVISQVLESIESFSVVLGCGVMVNYIWPGLFHPAKKVRDVYWRVFNNIYIAQSWALVPYYPRLEEVGEELGGSVTSYSGDVGVSELDIWV